MTTFKFRVYGDAPSPMDFLEAETFTPEMEQAKKIYNSFMEKNRSISETNRPIEKFSISNISLFKSANQKTQSDLLALGFQKGENFIQTPAGRLEWEYVGTKIFDPNYADSDVSVFKYRIK